MEHIKKHRKKYNATPVNSNFLTNFPVTSSIFSTPLLTDGYVSAPHLSRWVTRRIWLISEFSFNTKVENPTDRPEKIDNFAKYDSQLVVSGRFELRDIRGVPVAFKNNRAARYQKTRTAGLMKQAEPPIMDFRFKTNLAIPSPLALSIWTSLNMVP